MSTSNHPENSTHKPATPPQKKEELATSTPTASTEAASAPSMPSMPEPRSYAVSLGANASAVLVAYGIAIDLHTKGVLYGLAVGKQKVIQLRAADHPSSSELKHHVLQFAKGESGVSVLSPSTRTPPDYRSPEGLALLVPPKAPACQIVVVPAIGKKDRWSGTDLYALKRAATPKGVLSISVFQGLSKDEEFLLTACHNGVFTVELCEPDESFASAYMAAPVAGSLLAATGHKPLIENVRLDAEGRIQRQCQSCVSPDKLTREIHHLREEGRSLEEIGKALGFDKSTISRRLSALPYHLRRHCM